MPFTILPAKNARDVGAFMNYLTTVPKVSIFGPSSIPTPPPMAITAPAPTDLVNALEPPPATRVALAAKCLHRDAYKAAFAAQYAPFDPVFGADLNAACAESYVGVLDEEMFFARLAEVIASVYDDATLEACAAFSAS